MKDDVYFDRKYLYKKLVWTWTVGRKYCVYLVNILCEWTRSPYINKKALRRQNEVFGMKSIKDLYYIYFLKSAMPK